MTRPQLTLAALTVVAVAVIYFGDYHFLAGGAQLMAHLLFYSPFETTSTPPSGALECGFGFGSILLLVLAYKRWVAPSVALVSQP